MRTAVAEYLAGQAAEWRHRGLIDDELAALLQRRYAADAAMGRVLLRWLGFLAVFMLGMSVLGFIGMTLGAVAAYVAPFATGAFAGFAWYKGTQLATDPTQHHATSGAVLVTVGLLAAFVALVMLYNVFGGRDLSLAAPAILGLVAAAALFTAYRHGLRWPLFLGVLLAFHALGNAHEYMGHGGYFLGIRDERLTLAIALAAIATGLWHEHVLERDLERREVGFGHVYIVLGLFYANVCLWLLSIPGGDLVAVLFFTAAGIVQIILGARLHDARFTGFGIVFLSIDLYTRLFEGFWDEISKGGFLLLAGALAMAAGAALELRARKLRSAAGARA